MKIKFLQKKKSFKKGDSGIKPDLYWKYILLTTFILILLSCAFGLYLFIKVDKETTPPEIGLSGQETIKKERLDKVLEYFSEREKKSAQILNSPSPVIDPSL